MIDSGILAGEAADDEVCEIKKEAVVGGTKSSKEQTLVIKTTPKALRTETDQ